MKKAFWKSKAVWGGVLLFIGGGLSAIGLEAFGQPVMALGGALGFVGVRLALK